MQVDVFSETPFLGNPVAVVLDGAVLSDEQMLRFASWTNLSETTFVLPPTAAEADYRLRIFTPSGELSFAGHPTLGSAHAWLQAGHKPKNQDRIMQECGAGLVAINRMPDTGLLSFAAPATTRSGPLDPILVESFCAMLGIDLTQVVAHQWVDNGPGWAVIQVATAAEVLKAQPNPALMPDAKIGIIGAYPPGSPSSFEIRAFAPGAGVAEDPVTGSLNASVAQWMLRTGQVSEPYRVAQGTKLGRQGVVHIMFDDSRQVWVGGVTSTLISGEVLI